MTVIPFHEVSGRRRRVRWHGARYTPLNVSGRALATLREWRRRAHDRAQLARLDDRMLHDIGTQPRRYRIYLSGKPFWRE